MNTFYQEKVLEEKERFSQITLSKFKKVYQEKILIKNNLKSIKMAATIITTEDLREFKEELLEDIKAIVNHQSGFAPKKWLKSPEVRDLLSISPGTLQNLRINGTLPYSKVGGVIYYDYEEIQKVLEENRIHNKF